MTGTNHYLAGVGIAVVFKNPLLVIPMAFASHFILDIMPHFGLAVGSKNRGTILLRTAIIDASLVAFAVILTSVNYPIWYILAGLTAMSPDFAWIYRFTIEEKFGRLDPKPSNTFNTWHYSIQKLEFTWGFLIEIIVAVTLFTLLFMR